MPPVVRRISPCRRINQRAEAGFSLLELFIVLCLLGLFMGVVQEVVIVGLRAVHAADAREEIRQQLASALDRFTRDASIANNVDVAQTARFQFDTPSVNNVDYVYSSGTLTRNDASSSQITILRNLTAFDFDYVDCQGTVYTGTVASSAEDSLRVVQVVATVTKDQETIALTKSVFLRNMLGQVPETCGTL